MKASSVVLRQVFTAAGAVRLAGADITGQLNCGGARLTGADSGGNALVADRMKAGSVVLNQLSSAAGAVRLAGADITGQLNCRGARLTGADSGGDALVADGIRVGGDMFLDEEFTAGGAVRLAGADITGQLNCRGARLTGADSGGDALVADGIRVGGDMFLDEEFTAAGALSLRSAHVEGSLHLQPSGLADGKDKTAIDATGGQITHTLRWAPSRQIEGLVILEDAAAGQLADDWAQDAGPVNGYWPSAHTGELRLDGFTYVRTGGQHQATLAQRLAWIGSQHTPPLRQRVMSAVQTPRAARCRPSPASRVSSSRERKGRTSHAGQSGNGGAIAAGRGRGPAASGSLACRADLSVVLDAGGTCLQGSGAQRERVTFAQSPPPRAGNCAPDPRSPASQHHPSSK